MSSKIIPMLLGAVAAKNGLDLFERPPFFVYKTHGNVMHRIDKSPTNIYGAEQVTNIPINKPSIIAFGGEHTQTIKEANYYASILTHLLACYGIKGVDIYSAFYDFNSDTRKSERLNIFLKARSTQVRKIDEILPLTDNDEKKYIYDLYDIIIRPRITDNNGAKLPKTVALQNMRNIILFTHSHGSVPAYEFQDIMLHDMKKLGYDSRETYDIMRNLLVIQHAPMSPLENPKFNTFSFISANDTRMNFYNIFSAYAAEYSQDMPAAYFQDGQFFATYGFTYQLTGEHQFLGLVPTTNQRLLTPDGATIMAAERNAIINGIRAAVQRKPMPSIKNLVVPASDKDAIRPDFRKLAMNGESFKQMMLSDLRGAMKSKNR